MIRTIKKKISTWKLSLTCVLFLSMFFLLACQDQVFPQQPTEKPAQVSDNDAVFLVVEEPPTYPGGHEKMSEFISQNMKYPEKARKENAQGTVFVEFIVEKNGTVSEAAVLKGVSKECDEEALRVVKILSPWNPGKQSGKAVRVKFVLPIKFKL
jgi:protein TonB